MWLHVLWGLWAELFNLFVMNSLRVLLGVIALFLMGESTSTTVFGGEENLEPAFGERDHKDESKEPGDLVQGDHLSNGDTTPTAFVDPGYIAHEQLQLRPGDLNVPVSLLGLVTQGSEALNLFGYESESDSEGEASESEQSEDEFSSELFDSIEDLDLPWNSSVSEVQGREEPFLLGAEEDPLIQASQHLRQQELNDALIACIKSRGAMPMQEVQALLDQGADVNAADEYGWTVLIHAVIVRNMSLVEFLLGEGAEIDAVATKAGWTALIYAARLGSIDLVRLFLDEGANINRSNNRGETALSEATSKGNIELVKFLVSRGASMDHADDRGQTVLTQAVSEGNTKVTKLLVDEGANINVLGRGGRTALANAIYFSYLDLVPFFVNADARVDSRVLNMIKTEPEQRRVDLFNLLITRELFETIILESTDLEAESTDLNRGEARTVEYHWSLLGELLDIVKEYNLDIDLNAFSEQDEILLGLALRPGNLDLLKILLDSDYPFNLNICDKNGNTILDFALLNGDHDIIEYLREKGALSGDATEAEESEEDKGSDAKEESPEGVTEDPYADVPMAVGIPTVVIGAAAEAEVSDQEIANDRSRARKTRGLGKMDIAEDTDEAKDA